MDEDTVQLISNAIQYKFLLELRHTENDEEFLFAPYILYRFRERFGLFGTKREYLATGEIATDVADLNIETFHDIENSNQHYDKSFFIDQFMLMGQPELEIVCSNEDFIEHDEN